MKKYSAYILSALCISALPCLIYAHSHTHQSQAHKTTYTDDQITRLLDWRPSNDGCNLCEGYYFEPLLNPKDLPILPVAEMTTHINSDGTFMPLHKPWHLNGHVRASQPGHLITAKRGLLTFNKKNKPKSMDFFGHVHIWEKGHLFIGDHAHILLKNKNGYLTNAYYRFSLQQAKDELAKGGKLHKIMSQAGWGHAHTITQTSPKHFTLKHATFSTCIPNKPVWKVHTSTLELNKVSGRGQAYNAYLTMKGIPFFYTPYFNFPIDKRRQSGFLLPAISNSSQSGFSLTLPYYFNLAPNYDFLLTTKPMSKRGVLFSGKLRYLTKHSQGALDVYFIHNDRQFRNRQQQATDGSGAIINQIGLHKLEKASDNRRGFSFNNLTQYNQHLSLTINAGWVSDAYFNRDFYARYLTPGANMNSLLIPQQAALSYQGTHWSNTVSLLRYQTLEPIDVPGTYQPYSTLPALESIGTYDNFWQGFDFSIASEFKRFTYVQALIPSASKVTGNRLNIEPTLSRPFAKPYGYITPSISWMLTQYNLQNQLIDRPSSITRSLPIISVDSGIFFDKDTSFFKRSYDISVEPRAKYLYIPYRGQNAIPMFTSSISSMYYSELFTNNRFSGIDRIGDANQITVGMTTALTNEASGWQLMSASIGEVLLFSRQRVQACLTGPGCETPDNTPAMAPFQSFAKRSYLADVVTFTPNKHWHLSANSTWDPRIEKTSNFGVNMQYLHDAAHIVNFDYDFVKDANAFSLNRQQHNSPDSKSIGASAAWGITQRISALAAYHRDISEDHLQDYLLGIEYNACCWATRVVVGKVFTGFNPNEASSNPLGKPQFNKMLVFQFLLRGLAAVGNSNPSGLLTTAIPGYSGSFRQYEG